MPPTLRRLAAIAACLACLAGPASAQAITQKQQQEALLALTMVIVSKDRCEFEVTEKEEASLTDSAGMLSSILGMSDPEVQEYVTRISAAMEAQGWEKICDPQGAWAEAFRRAVTVFGKAQPQ